MAATMTEREWPLCQHRLYLYIDSGSCCMRNVPLVDKWKQDAASGSVKVKGSLVVDMPWVSSLR